VLSKKYYKLPANSILESVIALTIISICLYFAIMIFASVYTPKTSAKFYGTQNKVNELFYLSELKSDSISNENQDDNLLIEEERINDNLKKISIEYKDSTQFKFKKSFYVQNPQ
jgi:cell division protein FtsL